MREIITYIYDWKVMDISPELTENEENAIKQDLAEILYHEFEDYFNK